MISRRQFLQVAGISVYGLSSAQMADVLGLVLPASAVSQEAAFGRLLYPASVTDDLGIVISSLIPDTVVQIISSSAAAYTLNQGIVSRSAIQPMADFGAASFVPDIPCPVEVIAPAAAVRQWCEPSAPLISRVGHGGVLHMVDSLEVGGARWLGVASDSNAPLMGWTEAVRWREAASRSEEFSLADTLHLNRHTQQLSVFDGDRLLWGASAAVSQAMPAGTYPLDGRMVSSALPEAGLMGTPWIHNFSGYSLSGAYWHNQFGLDAGRSVVGAPIQLQPSAARWIYRHFRSNGVLHVV